MAEPGVAVKVERPDEAEIRELAAKMVEANRAKALAAGAAAAATAQRGAQPPVQTQPGQMGILGFLTRGKPVPAAVAPAVAAPARPPSDSAADKKPGQTDESSWKGHFGWDKVGECHIPYIFRQGEKYCAVRMVEVKLLNKYLNYLHQDIYSCLCIRSYYITEVESRLLNEINIKHCDGQFGRELFNQKDLVVRLSDANEFYSFLDICYNKLSQEKAVPEDKCGFIRINKESVVPYTVKDGQKYVPLFYFEGETDNLKLKADQLEGWDLSYLKFCCKVQGIRNELFASEQCSVISLTDIKSYFPPGTEFEEYWPNKVMDSQLLAPVKGSMSSANVGGQWTRAPPGPPAVHAGAPAVGGGGRGRRQQTPAIAAAQHQQQQLAAQRAQQTLAGVPHPSLTAAVQAIANGWNGLVNGQPSFGGNLNVAQTQQVYRLAAQHVAATRGYGSGNTRGNSHSSSSLTAAQARHHLQQQFSNSNITLAMAQQQAQNPPPLVRSSHSNSIPAHQSTLSSSNLNNSSRSGQQATNGHHHIADGKRLTTIPDVTTTGAHIPYKVQKALVENMMVPCINMKPYVYSELLMTLPDLVSYFFPAISLPTCRQVLEVLGLVLYRGNRTQMQVLRSAGKCKSTASDNGVALVQIRDVMKYMPQLKYMLARTSSVSVGAVSNSDVSEGVSAKRARAS